MADIWINILGDASKLKGALDSASGQVSSFSEKVGKIGKIATTAGTVVTGAFAAIITKTAEAGDKFDKMSKRTGVAVEDLSSLAYAAEISGTNIDTIENSLRFLARAMDDTSKGVGESQEAFEKLGISVVDSEGNLRPTIEVMKEAATVLAEMENETDKVATATDIFGSRYGTQLLPLLKEGGTGIEELMNKAKELGITMSTEAATKAAEFTDRMTDLKGSLAGAGRTIGDTLIPAVIPLIEKATEIVGKVSAWAEENPKLVETIVTLGAKIGAIAAVGGPVLMAVSAFSKMSGGLKLIGTILTPPAGFVVAAIIGIVEIWKNWDKIVEFVSGFVENIKNYLEKLKTIAIEKVTEMIDWIIEKFKDLANLPKKMMEWGKNAISGFGEGIKSKIGDLGEACKNAGNKIKNFFGFESPPKEGPLSKADQWMPNMMAMFGDGIYNNVDLVLEPLKYTGEKIEETVDNTTSAIGDLISDLKDAMESGLSSAFYSVLSGAKTFGEAMKDLWKSMIDAILQQIARLAASWIVNLIFPGGGLGLGILGFNKGGGVGYQFGGEVKKYQFGGLVDTVPARLTVGEYVISRDMTNFIRKFKAIPQNLIEAIAGGLPTPAPVAFATGGPVGTPNITASGFGETKVIIDIHDNRIASDVDVKRMAVTISDEVLRKIEMKRRH